MMAFPSGLNALDLLQQRINSAPNQELPPGVQRAIQGMFAPKPMPQGLPDAVVRSIQNLPSYGEGQVIPRPSEQNINNYSDFEPELRLQVPHGEYGERDRLPYELNWARQFPQYGVPLPEEMTAHPGETGSPYSRPYNLGFPSVLY
jgi:hypothetical protein